MLALIKDGGIISTVGEGSWVEFEHGRWVSPAVAGWSDPAGYSLVTVMAAELAPNGKQIVGTSVLMVDGVPKYVNELADTPVPDRVSARQFRMQLRISGLLAAVVDWVAGQDPLVQDSFEYSSSFVRSEPMMQAGFAKLGFSSEQVDEFFVSASKLGESDS